MLHTAIIIYNDHTRVYCSVLKHMHNLHMYTCTSQLDSSKPVLVSGDPEHHHGVKVDDMGVIFYPEQLISALVCVCVFVYK